MSPNPNAPTNSLLQEFGTYNDTRLIDSRGLVSLPQDPLQKAYRIRLLFRLFNPPTFGQYTNKSSNPEESFYGYVTPVWSQNLSTTDFEYVSRETKIPIKYPSQLLWEYTDDTKYHDLLHYLYHQQLITLLNQSSEPPNYIRYSLAVHPCLINGFKVVLLGDTKGEFIVQMRELRADIGGIPLANPEQALPGLPAPAPRDGRDPTPNERDEPASPALDGVNDNGQTFNPTPPPPPPPEPTLVQIQIPSGNWGVTFPSNNANSPGYSQFIACGQARDTPAPTVEWNENIGGNGFKNWIFEYTDANGNRQSRQIADGGFDRIKWGQPQILISPCSEQQ